METDLLALEDSLGGAAGQSPGTGADRIDRACRAVRSVKSGAGFLDLVKIGKLAQQTEDVLVMMRGGDLLPTPNVVHVLLHAKDRLEELIGNPSASNGADIGAVVERLGKLRNSGGIREAEAVRDPEPAPARMRALLVEDDFASRILLQRFLSKYGDCDVAVNGREAVEAFAGALNRGQSYHLICMDLMMPEMDGREAVQRIRALEESRNIRSTRGTKIIMTTAVSDLSEVILCFQELCDAYLVKPVDLGVLLREMKAHGLVE
jgi:two-component system chemotaxis response regulator CheY